jgi:hypothetical protein
LQILAGLFCITVFAMLNKQLMHKSNNSMMTGCY